MVVNQGGESQSSLVSLSLRLARAPHSVLTRKVEDVTENDDCFTSFAGTIYFT